MSSPGSLPWTLAWERVSSRRKRRGGVGVDRSPLPGAEARRLECTSGSEKREGEWRSAGSHCGLETRQVWRQSCSVAEYSERLRWHCMV